jgi:SPP1 family predicted phage head-tail adaptor
VRWSSVVNLIGLEEGTDSEGFETEVETVRERIFANKKSVRSNEYYLAKQSGINLSVMIEIRSIEYQGEEKLIFEGNEYNIERTYEKGENVELVCSRKSDTHGS